MEGDTQSGRLSIISIAKPNQNLYLLRKNSHDIETVNEIEKILNGRLIDFMFIDGDHSYEGVKKDYENYSKMIRSGGVIAFHDIAIHPPEAQCSVNLAWNEIKKGHRYEEIVKEKNQKWAGIGILFMD